MFVQLLRILGVTPDGSKTGKREAAWALIFIVCVFTGVAIYQGADITGVLTILWPAAIAAVFGAYKLEYDQRQAPRRRAQEGDFVAQRQRQPPDQHDQQQSDPNAPPHDWQGGS